MDGAIYVVVPMFAIVACLLAIIYSYLSLGMLWVYRGLLLPFGFDLEGGKHTLSELAQIIVDFEYDLGKYKPGAYQRKFKSAEIPKGKKARQGLEFVNEVPPLWARKRGH